MSEIEFRTAAVEDVLGDINDSNFLRESANPETFRQRGHVVVESVEEFELYREPYLEDARIALEVSWTDLLGDDDCFFLQATRGHSIAEHTAFTQRIDSVFAQHAEALERRAIERFGSVVGADVVTDVYNLIQTRAACGVVSESVSERRWALLKEGAWACGWNGGVDGSFAVFLGMETQG